MIKRNINVAWVKGLSILTISICPLFAVAQDPGGCPDCPVDGGLSLLLAAGVGYGIKKYHNHKKANDTEKTNP